MNNKSFLFLLINILFLQLACQNEPQVPSLKEETITSTKPTNSKGKFYVYADGWGNLFTIKRESIKYDPVNVILNSSGESSGEEPVDKPIGKEDFQKIKKLINAAMADNSAHISSRVKMSGVISAFSITAPREKVILAPSSQSKKELEEALKELIK